MQSSLCTFTYDNSGNLTGYDDGTTSAIYTYDDLGRKLSETVNYGAFSKTFSYTYYANGQKQTFTMPSGTTYSYTYNNNNELEKIRIPGVGDISYPSYTLNRPDSMTFPGGSQSYQYDALMRLDSLNAPEAGLNYGYTYDHVSNILTKTTEHGNYGYGYDDVYRLTSADNPTQENEAYTYDNVGNRDTASGVTGTIAHNANNELTVYGDITYDYDANGNMIRKSVGSVAVNYIYNVQNRLIRVEDELSGLVIAEYGYDPFGRRLWKEVDGTRTYFFYSDEGLVAEYDESGNELRSYGYQPDSTWTTDPLWLKEGREYYFYQNDHLGTPQKLIDINGTGVWSAQYTAFGEAQVQVATITNNLRFPGQYYDAETGLHYNYHRYYDPETGRYLRVDPIGFDGGDENLYAYVWNNPLSLIDVDGLKIVYGPRNKDRLEALIAELRSNPITTGMITHLDDDATPPVTIIDADYTGYPIPAAKIYDGDSFSGATVALNIQQSPLFLKKLCPHLGFMNSDACDADATGEQLNHVLLLVALAHELTHVYDAAKDMKAHTKRSGSERENRAVRIEAQVAHSYGVLARGDATPFPYENKSGMDFPYNKCFYYLVNNPLTGSQTHPVPSWK